MGALPPVFIEFLGNTTGVKSAIKGVQTELATVDAEGAGAFKKTGMMGKAAILGLGVAALEVTKKTVGMAADFQTQMTRVETGAGEAKSNLKQVGEGVLAMAGQVGESTTELTSGLYMVESAGYHGSAGLNVLKDSAEGAKVGAADMGTVTDAVTTALNAYKMGSDHAAEATNALIATEAEGKTNLEALAGSMASVLPTAAAAHVGLNEVLGAMATMTAQGTPAANAATYLRQTIGMLSNPSAKAAAEMKDLGLSSVEVGQNLGKNGLASTLEMLTGAITQHMGPAGTVLIQHLQDAAKNTSAYQKVLADLSPSQQTYIGALATMVGGTKSMQAALELTGPHLADFQKNVQGVNEHVKAGGQSIEGWSEVQKTFNQKMAEAKASAGAMGIEIGQYLMPYVQQLVGVLGTATTWLTQHKQAAELAAGVIGGVLVFALAAVTAQLYVMAAAAAVNPVVWIVIGVMALIAAVVLLATHWSQVWSGIKAATDATVGGLLGAWHWLESETLGAWHGITGGVTGAWRDTAAWFVGAWHSVADPVVGAWYWVRDTTVDVWQDVTGAVTGAWDDTAKWIEGAWHSVADPVVGAWHWVQDATVTVWDAITGWFRKWWPLLLVIFAPPIALLLALWNHFHEQITGTVHTVWNAVSGFFRMVWGGILMVAGVVWRGIEVAIINPAVGTWHQLQALWTTVSGWLTGAWHGIETAAGAAWGAMKAAAAIAWRGIQIAVISPATDTWHQLESLWRTVSGWLSGTWHGIEHDAGAIWHDIESAMTGPLHTAEHTISSTIGNIENRIDSGLHGALHQVEGIGGEFESIGRDIVMGIVHGVEHQGGALIGELGNLASDALSSAKNFLGINSPSKLFADQVGSAIPEGIALGASANAHLVHSAITDMAAASLGAFHPALVGAVSGGTLGLGGIQGGGGAVVSQTVHVHVDGSVLTSGDQLVALIQAGFGRMAANNPTAYPAYTR